MTWLWVFIEFFKTGLFAVGGGLATLPFLYDLTEKYDWFKKSDLSDMIAVSESTPGPIGVNCATYAGVNALGIWGGILSTVALVLPSLIIVLIIAKILDKFQNNKYVNYAFDGIKPAVTAMIAVAFIDVFKTAILNLEIYNASKDISDIIDVPALILFILLFFLMRKFKKIHPIVFIIFSAIAGIVFKF
jgi:chromate transporter